MTNERKQCLLKYLGYYDGAIDGVWGNKSIAATKELQKASGLNADGIFGEKTEEVAKSAVFYGNFKKSQETIANQPANWDSIKYFEREEFACKCGKCGGFPVEPSLQLVEVLDKLREHFGNPARINSGVRCKAHNDSIPDASKTSRHLYGTAADVAAIAGTTPKAMAAYAETLLPNTGGIGIYPWGIHIDVRKTKSRWNG